MRFAPQSAVSGRLALQPATGRRAERSGWADACRIGARRLRRRVSDAADETAVRVGLERADASVALQIGRRMTGPEAHNGRRMTRLALRCRLVVERRPRRHNWSHFRGRTQLALLKRNFRFDSETTARPLR